MPPHGSQTAVNYQKQTSLGSTTCGSSTPRVRKAGCCGSHLQAQIHTHVKGSGMHMVLKCLATHFNAIGETCIYWQTYKRKQHFYKHQQHIQPNPIWESGRKACGRHTHRSLVDGPGLLIFAVAGPSISCLCSYYTQTYCLL